MCLIYMPPYMPGITIQIQLVPTPFCCGVIQFQSSTVLPDFVELAALSDIPQDEMGCFITLTLWQLSPRLPRTCKGRYTTLLMTHCEAARISDGVGQESRPSKELLR